MKMTASEAAKILRGHNAWRRDDDYLPHVQTSPRRLGVAIDVAVAALERMTAKHASLVATVQGLPRYAVTKHHGAGMDPEGKFLHRDLVVAAVEGGKP